MIETDKIGRRGEDIVCDYLVDRGHTILERNWRWGYLEIDIISINNIGIHFVEVKSRVAPVQASPEENVRKAKELRIAKAARHYLKVKNKDIDVEAFIDVAAVTFQGEKTQLEYFEGVIIPLYL